MPNDLSAGAPAPFIMGSLWMLVAGLFFAGMGVFVKLGSPYFSSFELVFYRALLGVLFISVAIRRNRWSIVSGHWRAHIFRSLAGFGGMSLLFYSIGVLPLATATTLNYTSPLFLVLLSAVVLKERLRPWLVVSVVLGFSGVVLLLHPTLDADQAGAGLIGLASGFFAGIAILSTRRLGKLGEPPWRIVFYFSLVSVLGSGSLALWVGFHAVDMRGLLVLLCMGTCATLGQLCMTRAYRDGDTLTVGSLAYSTVVFTTLLSLLIWNEVVPLESWLAMVLIVISGIIASRVSATAEAAPTV